MKKIVGIVVLLLVFAGCNKIDKDSFRISGQLNNGESKSLYFLEMTGQGLMPLDTIEIDEKGKFSFDYKYKEPSIYVLMGNENDYITLIPQKQEDIIISGSFNSLSSTYTVKNSKESELLHQLNQQYIKTNTVLAEIKQTLYENKYVSNFEEFKAELLDQYNMLEIHQKDIIRKFLKDNKGSLSCIIALYRSFDNHYLFNLNKDLSVYEEVYAELNKKYPNNKHTIGLKNLIDDSKTKAAQDSISTQTKELANKK
jgi:predicted nucleic acid-binding Zn finger protein